MGISYVKYQSVALFLCPIAHASKFEVLLETFAYTIYHIG
jgi:hypothetical protein